MNDGDKIKVGNLELEVWHTPGHTTGQLSFRLGKLLFSGDNLFRDGCVGAIDAHHGSSIPRLYQIAAANPVERRRMAAAKPRAGVPQRRQADRPDDRPAGNLSSHGRFRHLCDRLAAHGPVGTRAGRRQDARVDAIDRCLSHCIATAACPFAGNLTGKVHTLSRHAASGGAGCTGFSLIPVCNGGRCYY